MRLSGSGVNGGRSRLRWAARVVAPLVILGAGFVGQVPAAEATSTSASCFVAVTSSGSGSCSFVPLSSTGHVFVSAVNATVTASAACTFGNSGPVNGGTSVATYTHAGACTLFYSVSGGETGVSVIIYAD